MKKNISNKKRVNSVKKFVSGAIMEAKVFKREGTEILKQAKKDWDSTKLEREKISAKVKKTIKKTVQMKEDLRKGFKKGVKEAQRKPYKGSTK